MARRSKYTPELVKRITDAIALGATYKHACNYAGISHETFYQWLKAKSDFSDAVKQAEGRATVGWLAKIEKAANDGAWQAAAWKLERRYPQDYGRTVQDGTVNVKHSGRISHTISDETAADLSTLTLEEQFNLDQALARVGDSGGGS